MRWRDCLFERTARCLNALDYFLVLFLQLSQSQFPHIAGVPIFFYGELQSVFHVFGVGEIDGVLHLGEVVTVAFVVAAEHDDFAEFFVVIAGWSGSHTQYFYYESTNNYNQYYLSTLPNK